MTKEKINSVLIIAFLLCLILPLICFNRDTGKISEEENRYLAVFPKPFTQDGAENWINDNIGFRSNLVMLHADIMYHGFGLSPSEKIIVGKDGWLFYTGDNNLRIAEGTYPLFEDDLAAIEKGQTEVENFLAERHCDYYLILPPSKVSIYPEYMRGNYKETITPDDIIEKRLLADTDIKVINLKQTLLNAKKKGQVFFKTDTHWNQSGAYAAYQKIHSIVTPGQPEPKVEMRLSEWKGEFSNMMGAASLLPEEKTEITAIVSPSAKLTGGDNKKTYIYHNDAGNGKTCVMFGDSLFGAEWNLRELFAEDYTDFIFIWSYDFDQSIVDKYDPDVVMYDMGERFVNALGDHCCIK